MDDLDRRLRSLASESLDGTAADVAVDADLAALRARAADRTVVTAGPRRSWSRLAVAATLVLFVAGAATILAARDGGEEVVSPPGVEVPASATSPTGPTTEPPPPTIGPVAEPAVAPAAVAEPSTAAVAWSVTITPSAEVRRTCQDIVSVSLRSDHGTEPVGLITPTGWDTTTPATIPACEGERSGDAVRVTVPDLEPGEYRFCIAGDDTPEGCAVVTVSPTAETTLDATTTTVGTTVPTAPVTSTTTAAPAPGTLPVGYFERVYGDGSPGFEIRQVSADGSATSTLAVGEVDRLLRRERPIGEGRTARLSAPEEPYGRCDAQEVTVGGPSAGLVAPLIGSVRSLASTEDGVVVVGVDVCPGDATWGDAGTRFELRRIDVATGSTTVLHVREPGDGDTFFEDRDVVYAGGELLVESVSADGSHVAVAEPYTTEDTRYHVIDAVSGGDPIAFGSVCDDPRDLVGPPQFVGDGWVVVARECSPTGGEVGGLVVELVSLATREPVWSVEVEGVAIDSYSHTVALDAGEFEGRVWAVVSGSAGVEQPIRAAAVTDGAELSLPDGAIVAFDPRELIEPWDPYP